MSFERKTQRGIALVTMALWMTAFLAFAVIGVDVGRLAFTANETQAVADSAATAGAVSLAKGSSSGQAKQDAVTVAHVNRINGSVPPIAVGDIETGQYNYDTHVFTAGSTPPWAIRATSRKTVPNMIAGVLGRPTSDVERLAIAGFSGEGQAAPNFPLAVGDCNLQDFLNCFGQAGATCKTLTQIPSTSDNTGWTTFSLGSNTGNIESFLPVIWKGGQCVAPKDPNSFPTLNLGDPVHLQNGQIQGIIQDIYNCPGAYVGKEFTLPVVDCDNANFNQSSTITGFVTIVIDGGDPAGKGINIHSIFKTVSGPLGGFPTTGTGQVALLK
jgi:hypothetical protein